jgi:four helix bundle protein
MSSSGLKRLQVWVQAKNLAMEVYKTIIPYLPAEEKWGLTSQIRRSAISISANIAEGYGRFYYQSNIQFCYNARGSLQETISFVLIATELGYLPNEISVSFIQHADALVVLLNGYISYLKKSKIGEAEFGSRTLVKEEMATYLIAELENNDKQDELDDSPISTLHSQD